MWGEDGLNRSPPTDLHSPDAHGEGTRREGERRDLTWVPEKEVIYFRNGKMILAAAGTDSPPGQRLFVAVRPEERREARPAGSEPLNPP